jgi:fibronectin type 3 domain-containing protein
MKQFKSQLSALILLACSGISQTITLQWDASQGASNYRVYASEGTSGFSVRINTSSTNAIVSVITNFSTRFYVTALSTTGESDPSNIVTVAPTGTTTNPPPANLPPIAPSQLRASLVTPHRIDIVWTSDLTAATEVERAYENAPFSKVATVPAGTLHWSDNGIFKKNTYLYRVRSVNQFGVSPYSNNVIFSSL